MHASEILHEGSDSPMASTRCRARTAGITHRKPEPGQPDPAADPARPQSHRPEQHLRDRGHSAYHLAAQPVHIDPLRQWRNHRAGCGVMNHPPSAKVRLVFPPKGERLIP